MLFFPLHGFVSRSLVTMASLGNISRHLGRLRICSIKDKEKVIMLSVEHSNSSIFAKICFRGKEHAVTVWLP